MHTSQWQQMQQRRQAGRLPHALLLTGPIGAGKGQFARRLAQALLCSTPNAEGDACGQCQSCHLFRVGNHPDYQIIQPEHSAPGDAGDTPTESSPRAKKKQSAIIKIDQVRALTAFLGVTTHYGGYKIVLIEPADQMNINAANSLLKTLEEPPGQGVLLLVTAHAERLPATVRSRCQRIVFTPSAIQVTNPAHDQRYQALATCYEQLISGHIDPIRAAEQWVHGDLAENLRWLIGWQTDMLRLKMNAPVVCLQHRDVQPLLQRCAKTCTADRLFQQIDALMTLYTLCTTTQTHPQWSLEVFFADCVG